MSQVPYPITVTVLRHELKGLSEIMSRWDGKFSRDEFLEELDNMHDEARAEVFTQLVNELKVASSKCVALVEVLSS